MRIVKTRLREMLPDVQVFLDVDNLGGGKDHTHIDVSNVCLCYLTQLWFKNKPCIREIVRAVLRKKPIIALLEHDTSDTEGGHTEAECRRILRSDAYRSRLEHWMTSIVANWEKEWEEDLEVPTAEAIEAALFASKPLIWYRLADFQDVTMRLMKCKRPMRSATVHFPCSLCPQCSSGRRHAALVV